MQNLKLKAHVELPTFDGLSSLNVGDIQHYICEFPWEKKRFGLYTFSWRLNLLHMEVRKL